MNELIIDSGVLNKSPDLFFMVKPDKISGLTKFTVVKLPDDHYQVEFAVNEDHLLRVEGIDNFSEYFYLFNSTEVESSLRLNPIYLGLDSYVTVFDSIEEVEEFKQILIRMSGIKMFNIEHLVGHLKTIPQAHAHYVDTYGIDKNTPPDSGVINVFIAVENGHPFYSEDIEMLKDVIEQIKEMGFHYFRRFNGYSEWRLNTKILEFRVDTANPNFKKFDSVELAVDKFALNMTYLR